MNLSKNIHVLPADKPSRLQLHINGKLHLENGQTIALKSFKTSTSLLMKKLKKEIEKLMAEKKLMYILQN